MFYLQHHRLQQGDRLEKFALTQRGRLRTRERFELYFLGPELQVFVQLSARFSASMEFQQQQSYIDLRR